MTMIFAVVSVVGGSAFAQVQFSGEESSRDLKIWVSPLSAPAPGLSQEARRLLEAAAAANDTDAMMRLAAAAESRIDAFNHVRRAAELGNHDAEYELAAIYAQGIATAKDTGKAGEWARKAAESGNTMAQAALGHLLLSEQAAAPSESKRKEGIAWLEKAAASGYSPAALDLGRIYALGQFGVPVDQAKSEAILKPFAEANDAECQFALASLYYHGKAFAPQRDLAIVWLQRARENGHPEAEKILGALDAGKSGSGAETPGRN